MHVQFVKGWFSVTVSKINVLPKKGMSAVSALATTLGEPRRTTGSASKKDE